MFGIEARFMATVQYHQQQQQRSPPAVMTSTTTTPSSSQRPMSPPIAIRTSSRSPLVGRLSSTSSTKEQQQQQQQQQSMASSNASSSSGASVSSSLPFASSTSEDEEEEEDDEDKELLPIDDINDKNSNNDRDIVLDDDDNDFCFYDASSSSSMTSLTTTTAASSTTATKRAAPLGDLFTLRLPHELRVRVLMLLNQRDLSRCARVCSAWHRVAMDGSLWARVDLARCSRRVSDEQLMALANRAGVFMRSIGAPSCLGMSNDVVGLLATRCASVEVMDLSRCRSLHISAVQLLVQQCPNLVRLSLAGVHCVNGSELARILGSVKPVLRRLRSLDLSSSKGHSAASVAVLVAALPDLTSLNLSHASQLTNDAVAPLGRLVHLEELSLRGCKEITDDGVVPLVTALGPQLRKLSLSGCKSLHDRSVRTMAARCPELRVLELAFCSNISDAAVDALARGCSRLEKLDLEEVPELTDAALGSLAAHTRGSLRAIVLSYDDKLTDVGLLALARGCPNIEQLLMDNCTRVTDQALAALPGLLHKLDVVAVYDCNKINQQVMQQHQRTTWPERVRVNAFSREDENKRVAEAAASEAASSFMLLRGDRHGRACVIL